MTMLTAVLFIAFADPPATVDPPAKGAKKVEPAKKDDPKKEAPSLFKKKKTQAKPAKESDDAGLTPEGPAPKTTDDKPEEKSKLSNADKDLVRTLGGELAGEEEDPLVRAAQRMRAVEEQLAKLQIEQETVVMQEKIVADLKEIIERAKKKQQQQQQQQQQQEQEQKQDQKQQQQNQKQRSQQNQKENESAKGDRGAQKTKEQLEKAKEQRDVWGHLPGLEQQLVDQSFKEEKLPEFKTQLEKYYSKIAEISAQKDK